MEAISSSCETFSSNLTPKTSRQGKMLTLKCNFRLIKLSTQIDSKGKTLSWMMFSGTLAKPYASMCGHSGDLAVNAYASHRDWAEARDRKSMASNMFSMRSRLSKFWSSFECSKQLQDRIRLKQSGNDWISCTLRLSIAIWTQIQALS